MLIQGISGQGTDFQRQELRECYSLPRSDVNGHLKHSGLYNRIFVSLQLADILGSRAFSALDNIKADTITLSQRFETFSLNGGMMDE